MSADLLNIWQKEIQSLPLIVCLRTHIHPLMVHTVRARVFLVKRREERSTAPLVIVSTCTHGNKALCTQGISRRNMETRHCVLKAFPGITWKQGTVYSRHFQAWDENMSLCTQGISRGKTGLLLILFNQKCCRWGGCTCEWLGAIIYRSITDEVGGKPKTNCTLIFLYKGP